MAAQPLRLPTADLNEPLLPTHHGAYPRLAPHAPESQRAEPERPPQKEGLAALGFLGKVFWLLIALLSQSAWGFYGVSCRYLQTHTNVPPLYLTFLITALASIALLSLVSVPAAMVAVAKACCCRGEGATDYDRLPGEGKPFGITRFKYAIGCGLAYFMLSITNIGALQLTQAYYVQLIMLALPIFVAILNRILFHQRPPDGLWATVFFVACGVGLVVYGGSLASGPAQHALSTKDAVGFALSVAAVFCLAMFLVLAQSSHGYLSHDQVLWSAFFTQLTVALFCSRLAEGTDLSILRTFDTTDWCFLTGAGVGVMFGANWLQQLVVRKIGAPLMSMFCPSTLVAATVGSYYFLDERLSNAFQVGGLVLVSLAICVFLVLQMRVR